jgi:hypothetical protein
MINGADEARLQQVVQDARQKIPEASEAIEKIADMVRKTGSKFVFDRFETTVGQMGQSAAPNAAQQLIRLAESLEQITAITKNNAELLINFNRVLAAVVLFLATAIYLFFKFHGSFFR